MPPIPVPWSRAPPPDTGVNAKGLSLVNGSPFFSGPRLPKEESESHSKLSPQHHICLRCAPKWLLFVACAANSLLAPGLCLTSGPASTQLRGGFF